MEAHPGQSQIPLLNLKVQTALYRINVPIIQMFGIMEVVIHGIRLQAEGLRHSLSVMGFLNQRMAVCHGLH